jgi:hypothetical protein
MQLSKIFFKHCRLHFLLIVTISLLCFSSTGSGAVRTVQPLVNPEVHTGGCPAESDYSGTTVEDKCSSLKYDQDNSNEKYNGSWYCVDTSSTLYFDEDSERWEQYTDVCYIWDTDNCQWINNPAEAENQECIDEFSEWEPE